MDSVSTPALLIISQPTPCTLHTHPHIPHLITAPHLSRLPTPLDIHHSKAVELVPWQSRYAKQDSPFSLVVDNSWSIGSFIFASLACLSPCEQNVAQGELLGLSLLIDDVLQTSDLVKTVPSLQSVVSDSSNARLPLSTSQTHVAGISSGVSKLSITSRQPSFEPMRGSGLLKMKQSSPSSPSMGTLASLHHLVPPLEGTQLTKQFLVKSSQLEVLKLEWGKKMLRLHSVMTKGHAELLESAYKDKVLSWVRKMVAKQQMRDLARMQAESVSLKLYGIYFICTLNDHHKTIDCLQYTIHFHALATLGGN